MVDTPYLDGQSQCLAVCPEFQQLDLEVVKSRRGQSASGAGLSGLVTTTGGSAQPQGTQCDLSVERMEMDQGPGPPCLGPL